MRARWSGVASGRGSFSELINGPSRSPSLARSAYSFISKRSSSEAADDDSHDLPVIIQWSEASYCTPEASWAPFIPPPRDAS